MANTATTAEPPGRVGRVRWITCALLFFAITINYVDRQIIGVLKPTLEKEFGWDQISYGNIVFAFQCAYAAGLFFVGFMIDRIGVKLGLALAVSVWSIAAAAHGAAHLVPIAMATTFFIAMRILLGIGEAGAFPAAIRATAEWFPKRERSLATGIFNSGSNVGAICTPLLVPLLVEWSGWPAAFYMTGALGVLWLAAWLVFYRRPDDHPRLSPAERDYIQSDPPDEPVKVSWARLLHRRPMWAFAIGKLLTDPIWWMYLFWVPDFFAKRHGLDLKSFGPPLVVIYLMADVGSIGGGWLSSCCIGRGWSVNAARKLTLLVCAILVTPIAFAPVVTNVWAATLLIGLAAAAHQGWSANLFTVVSDSFPRHAVASVVGLGGMFGAVGGMAIAQIVSHVLSWTNNSYVIPFAIAASAYLVALAIIQVLVPRVGEVTLPSAVAS